MKQNPYEDLLDLEHPTFPNHPPMPVKDRAAQFQPFAALDGFEAAIDDEITVSDCLKMIERDQVKVMIGGAPVTQMWADRIGADAFTTDAAEAARWAKNYCTSKA